MEPARTTPVPSTLITAPFWQAQTLCAAQGKLCQEMPLGPRSVQLGLRAQRGQAAQVSRALYFPLYSPFCPPQCTLRMFYTPF